MQDHVKLEVALEIVMSQIAETIFEINGTTDNKTSKIKKLINLQEEAYKANFNEINKILKEN